eukprot:2389556-Amphidinium_carterae.1
MPFCPCFFASCAPLLWEVVLVSNSGYLALAPGADRVVQNDGTYVIYDKKHKVPASAYLQHDAAVVGSIQRSNTIV